jgi:hypothetical protein
MVRCIGPASSRDKEPTVDAKQQESILARGWRVVMRDGSIAALGREALKDIQDTFTQVMFGRSDHIREPGAPLVPLFSDIKEARAHYAAPSTLPTPSQIARDDATVHGKSHDTGKGHATPSEIAREEDRGDSRGSNEQERLQILPSVEDPVVLGVPGVLDEKLTVFGLPPVMVYLSVDDDGRMMFGERRINPHAYPPVL